MEEAIVVTSNYVPGHRIVKTIGTIWGLTVRSRGLGGNIMAGFRSLAGGEIKEYVQLLDDARKTSLKRLTERAKEVGANAIVSVSFDSSEIGQYMTEILAYGTAVVVEPETAETQAVRLE